MIAKEFLESKGIREADYEESKMVEHLAYHMEDYHRYKMNLIIGELRQDTFALTWSGGYKKVVNFLINQLK